MIANAQQFKLFKSIICRVHKCIIIYIIHMYSTVKLTHMSTYIHVHVVVYI